MKIKSIIKINFSDFWSGFNKKENMFIDLLRDEYEVVESDEPEVLFFSCFGHNHLKYNCHKIYYTGENIRPNYKLCDFAFSFDNNNNNNYRLPFYRWRGDLDNLSQIKNMDQIISEKKKFCCMVISNPNCKQRNDFYKKLSKYKTIDSGGAHLNNIGYKIPDKMNFIKDYKFTISFENESYEGYTTEKIVEPMLAHSLPIYWGNPIIEKEFNKKSFINIHDFKNIDAAIEEIIKIDSDEELYKQYLKETFFLNNKLPDNLHFKVIKQKLLNVVSQFKNYPPINRKFKFYGYQNMVWKKIYSKVSKKHL